MLTCIKTTCVFQTRSSQRNMTCYGVTNMEMRYLESTISLRLRWYRFDLYGLMGLTHWGRVTHICVINLTIIGSDNGLSPGRRQAIILTNAGILLIRTLGTNFSGIWSKIHTFSFKKMHFKMSSAKWRQDCLGLNVLIRYARCGDISLKRESDLCHTMKEPKNSKFLTMLIIDRFYRRNFTSQ